MTKQINPITPTTCNNCNIEERWFLHHVRHRGIFRKLCTNCVLRLHTQSFCPTCYLVYHPAPPSLNGLVSCVQCYSYSHNSCVGPNPPHPYLCPLCVNPNVLLFSLKRGKDVGLGDNDVDRNSRVVDMKAAKVLLTAAKIAAGTVNKAALAARVEAERRAKEAAFTRKRAREALEHVAYLTARDKMMKKKDVLTLPLSLNGNRGSGNQCLSMVVAAVPLEEENAVNNGDNRLDGDAEVLVALNAVDLKGQNSVSGLTAGSNGSAMDVEDDKAEELVRQNGQTEMANDGTVNSNAGKPNGSVPQL
ncbi:uncharacterized protein LOC132598509 [Lycium barbarum]|uniref:uncharacterized protein LOC132598509 n=1 Tax=Lycium barbarum TaxID=112863 RepID=UPI00293F3D64|nr:uncharacterized protein LOC132598509 [Lycium barbarum]XP_060167415.1 uncharacterized protein LOC132598509 [Lycium barbarum]